MELTDAAIKKLILKTNEKRDKIRIGVTGGGCAGFEYIFAYESEINGDDHLFDYGSFCILIDAYSMPYLDEATLDYVVEGIQEQFKIINPKEVSSCGCGVSINFKV
jgi:iron-sulfur cluster assembly accessory protein